MTSPTSNLLSEDEKIDQLLGMVFSKHSGKFSPIVENFKQDVKNLLVEARIDELENRLKVQFIPSHWQRLCGEVNSWAKYVDRRIEQLKSRGEN